MIERIYLRPLEDHPPESELMKFRLVYEGELKATQKDPINNQHDRLAEHKQTLRKAFHRQMKELWRTHRFLNEMMVYPSDYGITGVMAGDNAMRWGGPNKDRVPLVDAIGGLYHQFGYRFVPLVRKDWSLRCALKILLLRRDYPGSVIDADDIDNRVKTLIDGLRLPQSATELRGNEQPQADETPFFCLLENDNLVTEFSVEADTLLEPPTGDKEADRRMVRAIITVEIQPYVVTTFNLAFA